MLLIAPHTADTINAPAIEQLYKRARSNASTMKTLPIPNLVSKVGGNSAENQIIL